MRQPKEVREKFLNLLKSRGQGKLLASKEEAEASIRAFCSNRNDRSTQRSLSYVQKIATDFATFWGEEQLEKVVENVLAETSYTPELELAAKKSPTVKNAVIACAILSEYIRMSLEISNFLGEENLLSSDWRPEECTYQEFESRKVAQYERFRAHKDQQVLKQNEQRSELETEFEIGQIVDCEVKSKGPIGYVVRVEGEYDGLVYYSDIFDEPPVIGEVIEGWVLKVREDGKLDVTLRPPGAKAKISDGVERILEVLTKGNGKLNLGDKSNPKEIYAKLGMSKKVFKEAIGHMYKKRMLLLEPTQIRLQPADMWLSGVQMTKKELIMDKKERKLSSEKAKQELKTRSSKAKMTATPKDSTSVGTSNSIELAKNELREETVRRRSEVMKNLEEDVEWKKREAAERLRQMKDQMARERERQKEIWEEERQALDPLEKERRKQLLATSGKSKNGGLKATLEKMRASKQKLAARAGDTSQVVGESSPKGASALPDRTTAKSNRISPLTASEMADIGAAVQDAILNPHNIVAKRANTDVVGQARWDTASQSPRLVPTYLVHLFSFLTIIMRPYGH
eukprot:768431-Hanusia_phi.AAC.17